MLRDTLAVARKEFRGFFASPAAYLFIGGFLVAALFIVFWASAFFARNIADIGPLFQAMPVLMVFLAGALTMRVWAEERRAGTLETLLTTPVRPISLVLGKFLAVEGLVALALLLTLPLPLTVAHLGLLDWGPVIGGYVATLCLAAAYVAVGLFVSAQSDNPVISLILTVLVCAVFYFLGSDLLTTLVSRDVAGLLDKLGAGSRFASITRGVLDLRDIYYYLSLVGSFLALNVLQLHRLRWAGNPGRRTAHVATTAAALLAVANLLAANLWLAPVTAARIDLTADHRYTLSDATKTALANLTEPLVIRGYFSSKTHPLLAPLVPQLRALLREYAAAGGGKVRVEFLNPATDPQAAKSAAELGIRPTPFQTASRYSASIVNSYFNIAVSYGGQDETLGFRNLIEVKQQGDSALQVGLANPEYAITSAILKATQAYRAGGNAYAAVPGGVTLDAYLSPEAKMPKELAPVRAALMAALDQVKAAAAGKFAYTVADPDADGGTLAKSLEAKQGLRPQVAGLLDPQPFWFSLRLTGDGRGVPVVLPAAGKLDAAAFTRAIDTAARHLAPGFLRTIALATPAAEPTYPGMPATGPQYTRLRQQLEQNARVIDADLSTGHVPQDTDVLMVLDPTALDAKGRFAVDQFLMRGGTVVVATSPFEPSLTDTLSVAPQKSGLEDWLAAYGVKIAPTLVLDPQNAALPVPVERQVGGFSLREVQMMPYPHFPDIRGAGLSKDSPLTATLNQLTLNWASPITLAGKLPDGLTAVPLVTSSPGSWTSAATDVTPDYAAHPDTGFAVSGPRGADTLAVALTGPFRSAFAGQPSPLLAAPATPAPAAQTAPGAAKPPAPPSFAGVIDHAPASAKLVVVASSAFGSDLTLQLASQGLGTEYTAPVDFLQNVADWATEDPALLALRGRTQYANTLVPMTAADQAFWEYLNYILAIAGLALVWGWRRWAGQRDRARYARILKEVTA